MSKEDKGKPELSLVYSSILIALAKVRRHGIEKYDSSIDWRDVPVEAFKDALLRHCDAFIRDEEEIDLDSGLPHAWLAAANLMYIIETLYGKPHKETPRYPKTNALCPVCKKNIVATGMPLCIDCAIEHTR
jgi:hypothetical protein